jgi:long-subunit acyl-CoA synthetase (AMP-forming)
MLYTAAFGGRPNGALLSHRAIVAQNQTYATLKGVSAESSYLNVGPLFQVAPLLKTLATFQVGGTYARGFKSSGGIYLYRRLWV